MSKQVRVLALDGGGVRGILGAAALAHLEQHIRQPLHERFDLVVGTSTGAILAAAVAMGIPMQKVQQAYQDAAPLIFGRPAICRGLWGPKYSNRELQSWLRQFFGEAVLNDAKIPICITSYDVTTGTVRVWKDDHASGLHGGNTTLLHEAVLSSASAPTFFPAVQVGGEGAFVDGGIWGNNPAMVGLVEAQHYMGASVATTKVVSIGTGRRKRWLTYQGVARRGVLGWGTELVEVVFSAQSSAVDAQMKLLLPNAYCRIDTDLPDDCGLDDTSAVERLRNAGQQLGRDYFQRFRSLTDAVE